MKRYLIIAISVLSGCLTDHEQGFIFPNSKFEQDTLTTWWRPCASNSFGYVYQPTNHDEAIKGNIEVYVPKYVATTNLYLEMMNDPFLKGENIRTVLFNSPSCGEEIETFYKKAFSKARWYKVRDIYKVEEGCVFWIRVYGKNDKQVLICISGPGEYLPKEKEERAKGSFSCRGIEFKFLRMEPSELLGNNYTNYYKIDLTIR